MMTLNTFALDAHVESTHSAYRAHSKARNSSAVSPCSRIGLSSLSPSCEAVMLESERAESVSPESWNIVSKADLSFVRTDRCT